MTADLPTRRAALASLVLAAMSLAAIAPPILSPDDLALAEKAAAYLQGLTGAKARFVQTDARGGVTQGQFWLQRPGRVRFQYDPPSGLVVASDGRLVSVLNPRLKTFQSYPLGITPLSVLLGRQIRLGHGVLVSAVSRTADGFSVVAHSGHKGDAGKITLDFSQTPLALTGWTITDARGGETRVRLVGLAAATGFDPQLFELRRPQPPPSP